MDGKIVSDKKNQAEKIICDLKCEVKKLKSELNNIKSEHVCNLEKVKTAEKKKANLEKLLNESNLENAELLKCNEHLDGEICQLKSQNMVLKEKIASISKESKKLTAENFEKNKKFCTRIKELSSQVFLIG